MAYFFANDRPVRSFMQLCTLAVLCFAANGALGANGNKYMLYPVGVTVNQYQDVSYPASDCATISLPVGSTRSCVIGTSSLFVDANASALLSKQSKGEIEFVGPFSTDATLGDIVPRGARLHRAKCPEDGLTGPSTLANPSLSIPICAQRVAIVLPERSLTTLEVTMNSCVLSFPPDRALLCSCELYVEPVPTKSPSTSQPSLAPSVAPTQRPSKAPTQRPTRMPSKAPTNSPTVKVPQQLSFVGAVGQSEIGTTLSISTDGKRMAIGSPQDNGGIGAVYMYHRQGATWVQQGPKLVGSGGTGVQNQGFSVALSGSGTTLAVGGPSNNQDQGAVWLFVYENNTWTQRGFFQGTYPGQRYGVSLAISHSGYTIVTAGSANAVFVYNATAGIKTTSGYFSDWSQECASNFPGTMDMDASGNMLVYATQGGPYRGFVTTCSRQVDQYGSYLQERGHLGLTLYSTGSFSSDRFASSISISSSGTMLAVGGLDSNNWLGVWLYQLNGPPAVYSTRWSLVSEVTGVEQFTISAIPMNYLRFASVAYSRNGTDVLLGSPYSAVSNQQVGAVYRYTYVAGTGLVSKGGPIRGVGWGATTQRQGIAVAVATVDGEPTLAWGANATNNNAGTVWVF